MSSSRDTGPFPAGLVQYDSAWENAEAYIAKQLHLDLDESEHLGDDWVLTPNETILAGCQQIIDTTSDPTVLEVLVAALLTSYHLRPVHAMLTQIADSAAIKWRDGARAIAQGNLLRRVSQAYRYGVVADDLDFVLAMCGDPAFGPQGPEDGEDLRGYWFESVAKLKDPRVLLFCRNLIDDDLGRWTDFRLIDAMRIVAKAWNPGDAEIFSRIAAEHPDSWIRRSAKSTLKRRT